MDRTPKSAPFPVGARVRYLGDSCTWTEVDGKRIQLIEPGIEVTVAEVRPGRQGTLRQCRDSDGGFYDDNGDPILDETRDGYSIYYSDQDEQRRYGRIIDREDIAKWELVT